MPEPQITVLKSLAALPAAASDRLFSAYALVRSVETRKKGDGEPWLALQLADGERAIAAVIWGEHEKALLAAAGLPRGTPVKVLFQAETWQDTPRLKIVNLRVLDEQEFAQAREALFGDAAEYVARYRAPTLVFDIETVPAADRRSLPPTIAEKLSKHAERSEKDPEAAMGLSPMFGRVCSLAFADADVDPARQQVTALVVPPPGREQDSYPDWIVPLAERDLLRVFWGLAAQADAVVTFNGKSFDVPFLITRSLVHGVPVRADLVSKPFALRPHLDLYRLIAGERPLGPGGLDVVCWALGIESPKEQMDGAMVWPAYQQGDIERIATYNAADVRATTAIYRRVKEQVLRYRPDW
jgi:hypothetical protein